jgi:alkylation response protein AidB-like acyl-CoA dehydrogenase
VEKHGAGYTTTPDYELMGSGGMEACDVYYDKFKVNRQQILGAPGKGMQVLQYWIAYEKIQQCAACVGMAAAALSEAIAYAKERTVRGKPQSGLQGVRWMLAEMHAKLEAARHMTYRAASLKDRSAPNWIVEAASAKLFVVPTAMEIVEMSRRIHGPYGYTKGTTIERLYRAAAGASAIAVSLEINKSIVGAALLK